HGDPIRKDLFEHDLSTISYAYSIHRSSAGRARQIMLTIVGWPSSASKKSFPDLFQDGSQPGVSITIPPPHFAAEEAANLLAQRLTSISNPDPGI
ncbi:hypothetical protein BGY98DRAFT_992734, partial [Russula aff. rugulosa BPL654]